MNIRIPKSQLLRQLPSVISAQLASCNDLPDYFDFKIFEIQPSNPKAPDEIAKYDKKKKEYPEVWKHLSPMQWFMFCVMLEYPDGAQIKHLAARFRNPDFNSSNNVAVHIKTMRATFMKYALPFQIDTERSSILGPGKFKLIKTKVT